VLDTRNADAGDDIRKLARDGCEMIIHTGIVPVRQTPSQGNRNSGSPDTPFIALCSSRDSDPVEKPLRAVLV
jgi:hypothetical protein